MNYPSNPTVVGEKEPLEITTNKPSSQCLGIKNHWIWILIKIKVFDDQKILNFTVENNVAYFWRKRCNIFILRPLWKVFKLQQKPQAPPPKKKAETSITSYFSFFVSKFCLPGSGSIRIRIRKKIEDEVRRQLRQSNMPGAKKKGGGRGRGTISGI